MKIRTPHTKALSKRFLKVMNQFIANQRNGKGKATSYAAFAGSINQSPQNFNKVVQGNQDVSAQIIEASCRKHKFNPIYLILGGG